MYNVLIVDDDKEIVNAIAIYLKNEGYKIYKAYDGNQAVEKLKEQEIHLIILDIMMPEKDGIETLEEIRKEKTIPVIMLSAKSEDYDKIEGLNAGADDYITKPFSVRELMARVKANLRKAEVQVQNSANVEKPKKENVVIELGDLILDTERFEVKVRGKIIDLTLREFEVLKYLANQPGQVVTRETLLEKVWGYEYYGDIRTVDVTVRRIREKIEKDTSAPKILITKRGVGYYLATN